MDEKDVRRRLETEEDFINLKRFGFSIREVMKRYPDGVPDRIIAQALGISEEEVEARYGEIVAQLRETMKVEDEED